MVVFLAFLDAWRGGEDHGAGLDAAHGDGLEVADGDDLAALHFLEGHKAVEARAHGAAGLALVLFGIIGSRGVADIDGGDVQAVGVGVTDGLENVTDTEIDKSRREGLLGCGGGLGLLGCLLLLCLLLSLLAHARGFGSDGISDLLASSLCLVLDLLGLLGSLLNDRLLLGLRSSCRSDSCACVGSTGGTLGSQFLLLLLALLLGLQVNGLDLENDIVLINLDLLGVVDLQTKQGRVLDKVGVTNNVVVSLLASALLVRPGSDDGSDAGVEGNVGDRGLGAEKSRASAEVRVERGQTLGSLSSVLGGRSNVRGSDEPLLNLGLLVGRVLVNLCQTSSAVLPLATHLGLGEERLRQLDHVALKLWSLRVGLL